MSAEELTPLVVGRGEGRVSVVGVGGAGNNVLKDAIGTGLSPEQCVAVNTDRGALSRSPAMNKILLDNGHEMTGGFGSELEARRSLQISVRRVTPFTEASDFTIVVAGLGGWTGTGAAPLIAQWSRSQVRPVLSVVAIPFIHERERRFVALRGLKKMVETCDCTVVIDNSMQIHSPSLTGRKADELASLGVSCLAGLLMEMNSIQKQNFRKLVSKGPLATLCSAQVQSTDLIQGAVFAALENPSAKFPISKTQGAVLVYRGPQHLTRSNAARAYDTIASLVGHDVDFLYGSVRDETSHTVCVLLTGYDYGTAVRSFVDFIEDLYDIEYGAVNQESPVPLHVPLFQMEQA